MLSENIITSFEEILSAKGGKKVAIENIAAVSGGSINRAYRLMTSESSYFLKCNDAENYPGMFEAEKKGLELLKANSSLIIPTVISVGENDSTSFIIMEFLEERNPGHSNWRSFGKGLAKLHSQSSDFFGLDYDNYIGSLRQLNEPSDNWSEFFMSMRLQPLIELAAESGNMDTSTDEAFEKFYKEIDGIFPKESPALLHGDLWSGNYFFMPEGGAAIFDPAVYYGHREIDIAMTTLFGSCEEEFYQAYNEHYPMEDGWQSRLKYANLYPLLVHLVLFGRSYLSQIKTILKPFT